MNKLCVLALPFFVACANSHPVRSPDLHTEAKGPFADDITRDVQEEHDKKHADCKFTMARSAVPLGHDGTVRLEAWTIDACPGKQFTYKVMFNPPRNEVTVSQMTETP